MFNSYILHNILKENKVFNENMEKSISKTLERMVYKSTNKVIKEILENPYYKKSKKSKVELSKQIAEYIKNKEFKYIEDYDMFRKSLENYSFATDSEFDIKIAYELKYNINPAVDINKNTNANDLNALLLPEDVLKSEIKEHLENGLFTELNSVEREIAHKLDDDKIVDGLIEKSKKMFASTYHLLSYLKRDDTDKIHMKTHPNYEKIINQLSNAILNKEKIFFVTDIDIDGTFGGLIAKIFKQSLPIELQQYIEVMPFKNGKSRGLNIETVQNLILSGQIKKNDKVTFVTVDNGVNSKKEVEDIDNTLKDMKIKVNFIITDHHSHDEKESILLLNKSNVTSINPRDITLTSNICGAATIARVFGGIYDSKMIPCENNSKNKELFKIISQHANVADLVFAPVSERPYDKTTIKDILHDMNTILNFQDILSYSRYSKHDFIKIFANDMKFSEDMAESLYQKLKKIENDLLIVSDYLPAILDGTLSSKIVNDFIPILTTDKKFTDDESISNVSKLLIQAKEYLYAKNGIGKNKEEVGMGKYIDNMIDEIREVNKTIVEKLAIEIQKRLDYHDVLLSYLDKAQCDDLKLKKDIKTMITSYIEPTMDTIALIDRLTADIFNEINDKDKKNNLGIEIVRNKDRNVLKHITTVIIDSNMFDNLKLNKKLFNVALLKTGFNMRGKDGDGVLILALKNDEGYTLSVRSSRINILDELPDGIYGHNNACGGQFNGAKEDLVALTQKLNNVNIPRAKKLLNDNPLSIYIDSENYSEVIYVITRILQKMGIDTVPDNTGIELYVKDRANIATAANKFSAVPMTFNGPTLLMPPTTANNTGKFIKINVNDSDMINGLVTASLPKSYKSFNFERKDIEVIPYEEMPLEDAIELSLGNSEHASDIYYIVEKIFQKRGELIPADIETANGFERNGQVANLGIGKITMKDDKLWMYNYHFFNKNTKVLVPAITALTGITRTMLNQYGVSEEEMMVKAKEIMFSSKYGVINLKPLEKQTLASNIILEKIANAGYKIVNNENNTLLVEISKKSDESMLLDIEDVLSFSMQPTAIGLNFNFDIGFLNKSFMEDGSYMDIMNAYRKGREFLQETSNLIDIYNESEYVGTFNLTIFEQWLNDNISDNKDLTDYIKSQIKDGMQSFNKEVSLSREGNIIKVKNNALGSELSFHIDNLMTSTNNNRLGASGELIAATKYCFENKPEIMSIADDVYIKRQGKKNKELGIYHVNASTQTDDTTREFFASIEVLLMKGIEPEKIIDLFVTDSYKVYPVENIKKDYLTLSDISVIISQYEEYKEEMLAIILNMLNNNYLNIAMESGKIYKVNLTQEMSRKLVEKLMNDEDIDFVKHFFKSTKEMIEIEDNVELYNRYSSEDAFKNLQREVDGKIADLKLVKRVISFDMDDMKDISKVSVLKQKVGSWNDVMKQIIDKNYNIGSNMYDNFPDVLKNNISYLIDLYKECKNPDNRRKVEEIKADLKENEYKFVYKVKDPEQKAEAYEEIIKKVTAKLEDWSSELTSLNNLLTTAYYVFGEPIQDKTCFSLLQDKLNTNYKEMMGIVSIEQNYSISKILNQIINGEKHKGYILLNTEEKNKVDERIIDFAKKTALSNEQIDLIMKAQNDSANFNSRSEPVGLLGRAFIKLESQLSSQLTLSHMVNSEIKNTNQTSSKNSNTNSSDKKKGRKP